ncbi:MAG TPA: hydantoinase B/oxoprolinase family protein [Longimicrobiales bacterium]
MGPVRLQIYRQLFAALAEEMGAALRRASYSPNIKERRDYSCAVFDGEGRVVAMGDHMPVHLGAMPLSVAAALALEPGPGDVVALNDPFRGGTHLPDITVVKAVFAEADGAGRARAESGRPLAYLAARAHHADVGGMAAGSMPLAREVFQEGLRIPPVRLVARGERQQDVWRLILSNVRTPEEREGDLEAQLAALVAGERRLAELVARRGEAEVVAAMAELREYGERLVRAGLERIPDGVYEAEDWMEDDGLVGGPYPIRVRVTVRGDEAVVDFTGTAAQATGGINAVTAITMSCVRYVVRCVVEALLGEPLPAGGGDLEAVRVVAPEGSLVAARPPASVAAGNVETSQRIADVLLLAFAQALPDRIPAQSQGTMNNLSVGGTDPRTGSAYAYYETVGGGMGAGPGADGLSGVHVHMTNSLNTPIEALEHAYPFRVRRYEIRRGSGGRGLYRGGDGLRRDLELLAEADVSLLTERRTRGPAGLAGGEEGAAGENRLLRGGAEQRLPAKVTFRARAGDVISVRTPGGGGWGAAPGPARSTAV